MGAQRQTAEQGPRDVSTVKLMPLGTIYDDVIGRRYRYGFAGAVDLAAGKMVTTPAAITNHTDIAVTAATAAGSNNVTVTLGATLASLNQYENGAMTVISSTGAGIEYRIRSNPAAASAASLKLALDEPVVVALATTSKVALRRSPWAAVVIAPAATGVAQRAAGVPNVAITAASYGYFQTRGDCSVLSDGIVTKNAGAILSDAVDGAVEIEVAGTLTKRVGTATEATVDTKYYAINLAIE
jgi:hypothetical protein